MIRNRYNYPTPPIRDIKGKETQTRNNWTLLETSLAESQTDSYFPTKWPNSYPKQKDVSDTHIQRRTITKINHDRRTVLELSVKSISLGSLNQFYVAQSSPLLLPRFRHINCSVHLIHQCYISENTKHQQITEMKQR